MRAIRSVTAIPVFLGMPTPFPPPLFFFLAFIFASLSPARFPFRLSDRAPFPPRPRHARAPLIASMAWTNGPTF